MVSNASKDHRLRLRALMGTRPLSETSQWVIGLIVATMSLGLFLLDSWLSHGTIPAIGYSVLILLSMQMPRRYVVWLAILCSVFTWIALWLEPASYHIWEEVVDRLMITAVVWITTVLSLRLMAAEKQLAEKAAELARSNVELEQFASLVSHDLRSPLTSILQLIEISLEESGKELNPEIREMLGMARNSAREMGQLITRLLDYSRAGHQPLQSGPCNSEAVVSGVLQRLSTVLKETDAKVTCDPLPVISGDKSLLAQLFQNLIENAAKYRGPQPPRIHISAEKRNREYVFTVRDNGTGLPEGENERIFEPFVRGTRVGAKKGSGIGLATCKMIVERHHGRIWADSKPGEGSTFYFALPNSTEKHS